MAKIDPFDDQRSKGEKSARYAHLSKEEKDKRWILRELCWKAIDERDENFSIIKTAKSLGIYERKS